MEKWLRLKFDNKIYIAAFCLLGIAAFVVGRTPSAPTEQIATAAAPSVDTFIPKGFVLVPLELANADSLNSLVGDMGGVVDLYLASNDTRKGGLKVGAKLKLLRAPLNPQQYAVLVKDSESPRILSFNGPFIAVVQNPDARGAGVTENSKRKLSIDYQN